MIVVTNPRPEPCANMARRLRAQAAPPEMSHDALEFLVDGYAKLVESLLDPRASAAGHRVRLQPPAGDARQHLPPVPAARDGPAAAKRR